MQFWSLTYIKLYLCTDTQMQLLWQLFLCKSSIRCHSIQVFQYDGSTSCFTPFLGFFFFFGLVTVVLFVVPLPGFLMFICVKRPPVSLALYNTKQDIGGILTVSVCASVCLSVCLSVFQKYKHYADVLTIGLKDKHSWFGGWDIARRLPFVLIAFFVVLGRPSIILVSAAPRCHYLS